MITFPTNISSKVKNKCKFAFPLQSIRKSNVYVIYCFINVVTTSIFHGFFDWFLLHYTDFAHATSLIMPCKYDLTSGTKIFICLEKCWRMRRWIRTNTFQTKVTNGDHKEEMTPCIHKVQHYIQILATDIPCIFCI